MSTKYKKPQLVGKSVFSILRKLGIEVKVLENMVLVRWDDIVGERIAKATSAERIENGTLFVKVKSSAWRNELVYLKRDLLMKIDNEVGRGIIKDIKYI